jgi:cytochrome c
MTRLVSLLALGLVACGGNEAEAPAAVAEGPPAPGRLERPADIANGSALFRQCSVCHDPTKDGAHRVGPKLWGVVGAPAARFEDFRYSNALERAGIVWDEESLSAYLKRPQEVVPGGRMAYAGMPNPADRRDVIAYLTTLHDEAAD